MAQPAGDKAAMGALQRDQAGREAFFSLLRSWMVRSNWSLALLADLCEEAMRAKLAAGVGDWDRAKRYREGALVVSGGSVWKALRDIEKGAVDPKKAEDGWEKVAVLRRVYPSQLHQLQLGQTKMVSPVAFEVLGELNLWLAELRRGRAKLPASRKLQERLRFATVVEDADGPFGPEELLSVYLGRLVPPLGVLALTEQQANDRSRAMARRIREGFRVAGLDLVDDWPTFVRCYPTSDQARLAKVRDVALSQAAWSPEQVEDEEVAVAIALKRLLGEPQPADALRVAEGHS